MHPFIGRDAELARLEDLVGSSRASSRLTVALVQGDMGVGKSRLLDAIAERTPAIVLTVVGGEWERSVPFAAAAPMLRSLEEVGPGGSRLVSLWEGPVRQLEPLQVLEVTRRCLAEIGPTLVLVDDLQWVDRQSLALVHYLLRDAESARRPLSVVAASRPGSVAIGFGLAARRLVEDPLRICQFELRPLAGEDSSRLLATLRPDLDAEARSALVRRAGGFPFWLTELAHADDAGEETTGLVAARLASLSSDARRLAALLAMWTSPADDETLGRLLGWPPGRCVATGRELVDAGLVVESAGALQVVHDTIGEAVVVATAEGVRRELHAAVAAHLDGDAGDETALLRRVLVHRRAAGAPAADTARRLVRSRHRRLLGPEDIEECAEIARGEATADEAHALLREVAELASEIGRPDLALEHWTALMVESGSALERGRARLRASQCALAGGDPKRARALLGDAEPKGLDLATRIEWHAHASQVAASSGPASSVPLRRAVRLSRELSAGRGGGELLPHERAAQITAMHAEFYHALRTEQVDAMLSTAERIVASARGLEDRLRGALHASFAHRLLGQYVEAEEEARAVRLAAVREPLPAVAFEAGFLLAATQYSLGQLVEARAAAEELAAMADRAPVVVPSWLSAAWVNALGPEIDVSLHGWPAARDRLSELVRDEPHPHFRLHIRLAHAQWASRLAHPSGDDEVLAGLAGAREDADAAACNRCGAEVDLRSAEAYARIGRLSDASDALQRWESTHRVARGQSRLWRDRARALVLGYEDPSRAAEQMKEVGRTARSMRTGLEVVWAELDLGQLLTRTDTAEAAAVLRRAAQLAHEIHAGAERQRAKQLLRGCGVRTWAPGRRSAEAASQLSDRERAIVEMIRAGASNPEIAEALFISRKTVERHVSNALAKTNTRNRAELAARAQAVRHENGDADADEWSPPQDDASRSVTMPVPENR